ncbi:MAG: DUF1501 domain-containing protein [Isosphaeraceae bacterium]|nr:DUF1501 domain-containing protein [Isosphaeraceae bacterium]
MIHGSMSRRQWLWEMGGGLGGIALAQMLSDESRAASLRDDRPSTHHRPKATRVVQMFMSGAASQCDTFDYKPELIKRDGRPFEPGGKVELFQSSPGAVMRSPWGWSRRGESGKYISDLLPCLGSHVDRMAFVHSMVAKSNVHGPATFQQSTGFVLPGFPAMGAWVSFGLGTLNQNLPTFVVIPDSRGYAPNGPANWSSGFLPATHQGTAVRPGAEPPIFDLFPARDRFPEVTSDSSEKASLRALEQLNRRHQTDHREDDTRLDARIQSYQLAARLQLSAPEALDIGGESKEVRSLYGLDDPATADFGRSCLVARRLLERGVRFIQLWNGADNGFPRRNWDSHEDLARDHGILGKSLDRPAAALIEDLARIGLLDETVILWTTEFGRMPCSQGGKGRDHNPFTFTNWLAGGGIKGGTTYGASDEWSFRAVENPTSNYDIHATILHLLGIDHTKLTVRHNGIDRRLTDVHGTVLGDILA